MYAVYFCAGFQEQLDVSPVEQMKTQQASGMFRNVEKAMKQPELKV
jgi:hypothetical protein